MTRSTFKQSTGVAATIVALMLLSACLETTEPPPNQFWEGELITADADLGIEGTVRILALAIQTQMEISITGAEEDSILGWAVRTGTCASAGNALGPQELFPPIEVDEEGDGTSLAFFQGRLNTTGQLSGVLLADLTPEPEILACADLERLQGNG